MAASVSTVEKCGACGGEVISTCEGKKCGTCDGPCTPLFVHQIYEPPPTCPHGGRVSFSGGCLDECRQEA